MVFKKSCRHIARSYDDPSSKFSGGNSGDGFEYTAEIVDVLKTAGAGNNPQA